MGTKLCLRLNLKDVKFRFIMFEGQASHYFSIARVTESSHARGIIHMLLYCSSMKRFSAVMYVALILSIKRFMCSNKLGGLKWCLESGAHKIQIGLGWKPLFTRGVVKVKVFPYTRHEGVWMELM